VNFESWFGAEHPKIPQRSVAAVLELAGEGATVPFIARYRKEKTGNLDEVAIRAVIDAKETWDEIIKRQLHILGEIDKQKKLTPELRDKVLGTFKLDTLEDIYLPYKQKRKTKAVIAKEAGLEPLADWIWSVAHGTENASEALDAKAASFVNKEKGVADSATALAGAQDILTEKLSEMATLREFVRTTLKEKGFVRSAKGEKAKTPSQYENYFSYSESVKSLQDPRHSHRYLALRRGWTEGELTASIGGAPTDTEFDARLVEPFLKEAGADRASSVQAIVAKASQLALKAYVLPSIENEIHKGLKDAADLAAVQVFAENVGNLLLAAPFGPKTVLGVDPGLRTGCKLAVVESSGKFVAHDVIHIQSDNEKKRSGETVLRYVKENKVRAVAVGNGTAGRETEHFVRETLKAGGAGDVPVVMVSESGASVYSASDVAREEFPDLDVTVRGAISIARRLQDPLAELVKVDPKSIGVGQYQHDVSATLLKKSLNDVVDSCVNKVGVNLNTASQRLLARVSGIGGALAKAVVDHRASNGLFASRQALLDVPHFSKKAFEQAAGFLRVPEADNPLDNTGVHPERYALLESLAEKLGKKTKELVGEGVVAVRQDDSFKKEVGEFTFNDIVAELEKPGRDPRDEFVPFSFRDDIHELSDLKPGLECPGIVTNVTNFGAFVDIGVHQDGLVHVSQLSDKFVKDPREVVKPGDRVQVKVLDVKIDRKQISLTMRKEEKPQHAPRPQPRGEGAPRGDFRRGSGGGNGPRPDGRRFDGPRQGGGGHGPRPGGGRHDGGQQRRPQKPFVLDPNNPFHKLAALRDQLEKPEKKK
jgi:protein Tex